MMKTNAKLNKTKAQKETNKKGQTLSKKKLARLAREKSREEERKRAEKKTREKEAKARRELNEKWQKVETSDKYGRAVVKSIGRSTTDKIADEILDGIFLSFNERHGDMTIGEQKKLLRRIVEKRQAQALHAKKRNFRDRRSNVDVTTNSSKCMERIQRLRFAS